MSEEETILFDAVCSCRCSFVTALLASNIDVEDLRLAPKFSGEESDFRPFPIRPVKVDCWLSDAFESSFNSVPFLSNSGNDTPSFADVASLVTCLTNSAIDLYAYFAYPRFRTRQCRKLFTQPGSQSLTLA